MLENSFISANQSVQDIIAIVTQNPQEMTFAWEIIQRIYDLFLPVGYSLIALFFMISFLKQSTEFHNVSMERTAALVVKLVIVKLVMDNSFELILAIFNFTNAILSGVSTSVGEIPIFDLSELEEITSGMSGMNKLVFQSKMMIYSLIMTGSSLIVTMISYGRFIEMFVLTAFAPLPLSTLVSDEVSPTVKRYFQELLAVCLQGVVIMGIVLIYSGFAKEFFYAEMGLWGMVTSSLILAMMMFKSGGLARKITGV